MSLEETLHQHASILDAIRSGKPREASLAALSHLRDFYFSELSASERKRVQGFVEAMERA